jgi:hypothetical protein
VRPLPRTMRAPRPPFVHRSPACWSAHHASSVFVRPS